MITYKLQNRILKLLGDETKISYPCKLIIDAEYGPLEVFGLSSLPSRLSLVGGKTTLIYDANVGRVKAQSNPPLKPLFAQFVSDCESLELNGNILHLERECQDEIELHNILLTFLHSFPAILNLEFPDPPYLTSLTGELGKVKFRWEHQTTPISFSNQTKEQLEKHVVESIKHQGILKGHFLAAICYFHTASRLNVAGISSWEFMSESILNYCKVLQSLFGDQMDDVRKGLRLLNYTEDEIEIDFIPLLVLRNYFDVGHIQIVIPEIEQLQTLYFYLFDSETKIRKLLKRVLEYLVDGRIKMPEENYIGYKSDAQRRFNKLIEKIRTRTKLFIQ